MGYSRREPTRILRASMGGGAAAVTAQAATVMAAAACDRERAASAGRVRYGVARISPQRGQSRHDRGSHRGGTLCFAVERRLTSTIMDASARFAACGQGLYRFASAHFITFAGHRCESLHGITIGWRSGSRGPRSRELVRVRLCVAHASHEALCDEIDHKVLLPLHNPNLASARWGRDRRRLSGTPRYRFRGVIVRCCRSRYDVECCAVFCGRVKTELARMRRGFGDRDRGRGEYGQSAFYRERF